MAVTSGFYNSLNEDRKYEAVQFGSIFDGVIADGVFATYGSAFQVTASGTGLIVNVGIGRAWFNHTWTLNDAILPLEAEQAEVVLNRIDAVVLEVDASLSGRANTIKIIKGTPGSTPQKPTMVHTTEVNQYPLAYLTIRAEQEVIQQSDIENAVGTTPTPFVTGIIDTIDVSVLTAQWQAQFENMMRDDQQDFENWEILTKAAYEVWFNAVKAQMQEDISQFEGWETATKTEFEAWEAETKDDFDSWFQNLQDELDENQAAHLQRQIGNLNALDTSVKTDLVSALNEVNSRVTTSISEILLDYDPEMEGVEVTLSHTASAEGHTPEEYTVTLDDTGEVEVDVKNLGEWVITWTHDGTSYTETLNIEYYGYYHVLLHEDFAWRQWVVAGGISILKHDSLASLLADEADVRRLMTIHAAVDYLVSFGSVNADLTTVINDDYVAKWTSLRDYAMDKMEANAAIKTVMDTSGKYGYGEYGLVGQIPAMTSDTTPSGVASSSGAQSNYQAYKAFDNDTLTYWASTEGTTNIYLDYHFVSPVSFKTIKFKIPHTLQQLKDRVNDIFIKISTDGFIYNTIKTINTSDVTSTEIYEVLIGASNVSYVRIEMSKKLSNAIGITECQVYGGAPLGAVPVMTSDTAPYGECAGAEVSGNEAYHAFDGDKSQSSSWRAPANQTEATIQYTFTNPICVKGISYIQHYASAATTSRRMETFKIQGSNDGKQIWVDITPSYITAETDSDVNKEFFYDDFTNNTYWKSVRIYVKNADSSKNVGIAQLQFYGRQLKVSVPTMTSNTAPYGIVSSTSYASGHENYKAFDNSSSDYWIPNADATNNAISYTFPSNIELTHVYSYIAITSTNNAQVSSKTLQIQYHDGSSWVSDAIGTITTPALSTTGDIVSVNLTKIDTPVHAKAFRLFSSSALYHASTPGWIIGLRVIQFYGKDYSECEWDTDHPRHYLYDHGVELVNLLDGYANGFTIGNSTMKAIQKNADNIFMDCSNSLEGALVSTELMDLTQYNMMFAYISGGLANGNISSTMYVNSNKSVTSSPLGQKNMSFLLDGLDASSINTSCYCVVACNNVRKAILTEFWLQ